MTAALQADPTIDTVLAPGAGPAGELWVAALGKGPDAVKVAPFDLSVSCLESVVAGDAVFAIDQKQFLQGSLAVNFLAQHADFGLMPGGNVASGPNLITADRAGQVVELSAQGNLRTRSTGGDRTMPTVAGSTAADERRRAEPLLTRLMKRPDLCAFAGLVLVTAFVLMTACPSKFTLSGILNFMVQAAQPGILVIAAALLRIGGEFDLSIASMVAFAGMIFGARVVNLDLPLIVAVPVTLILAAGIGSAKVPGLPVEVLWLLGLAALATWIFATGARSPRNNCKAVVNDSLRRHVTCGIIARAARTCTRTFSRRDAYTLPGAMPASRPSS